MPEITSDDLRAAVAAGHLTEAQAASVSVLAQQRAGARQVEDEPFELFKGFSEIFVAVGLGILILGGFGLALAINIPVMMTIGAACIWMLARYFTLKRRMMLPSILLVTAFGLAVLAVAASLLDLPLSWEDVDPLIFADPNALPWLALSGIVAAALLVWFRFFRVPFTMFLLGLTGLFAVLSLAVTSNPVGMAENPFDLGAGSVLAWGTLLVGLLALAGGTWFDMRDPHRLGRMSASGFWLHIVAATALVHTIAQSCLALGPGLGYWLMAAALVVIALLALVLDRRSFLTAGIGYFIFLLSYATNLTGDGGNWIFVFLFMGVFLTLLGSYWIQVRCALMRALPSFPGKHRLPPYGAEAA